MDQRDQIIWDAAESLRECAIGYERFDIDKAREILKQLLDDLAWVPI